MKPLPLALSIAACLASFPARASDTAPAKPPAFEKPSIDKEAAKAAVEKARSEIKAQNPGAAASAEPPKTTLSAPQAPVASPQAAPKKPEPAPELPAPGAARRPSLPADTIRQQPAPASKAAGPAQHHAANASRISPARAGLHEKKTRAKPHAQAGSDSAAQAAFGPDGDAKPAAATALAEAGLARNYMLLPFLQDRQTVIDRRGCLWTLRNASGYSEMVPAADGLCLQASRPLDTLAQRMEFAEYSRIAQYARRMADGTLFRDAYGCVYVFGPASGKPAAPALARPDGSAACYDKGARP